MTIDSVFLMRMHLMLLRSSDLEARKQAIDEMVATSTVEERRIIACFVIVAWTVECADGTSSNLYYLERYLVAKRHWMREALTPYTAIDQALVQAVLECNYKNWIEAATRCMAFMMGFCEYTVRYSLLQIILEAHLGTAVSILSNSIV